MLMLPSYAAAISAAVLLLYAFSPWLPVQRLWAQPTVPDIRFHQAPTVLFDESASVASNSDVAGYVASEKPVVSLHGGLASYIFKITRLLACTVFLVLSCATFATKEDSQTDAGLTENNRDTTFQSSSADPWRPLLESSWVQLCLCTTAAYTVVLASITVKSHTHLGRTTSAHLTAVLLVLFTVFAYRDVWPLLTFTWQPIDSREGLFLWGKIATLAVGAVVCPMFSPRLYVPFDVKNPSDKPHPEQTASWASMVFYLWVEPTVRLAYGMAHLPQNLLPPLSDQDYARNLKQKSFPHLDQFSGAKKQHIFFGLMTVFRVEFIVLAAMIIIQAFTNLAPSVGIKYLLQYVENTEDANVRPAVWILLIFFGTVVSSLAYQWYIFIVVGCRTMVRLEVILTQLIFEHALRIRMQAETEDEEDGVVQAPLSVPGLASGNTTPRTKAKTKNLVGKLNNLVTSDLASANDGRDFLNLVLYAPLQLILATWFLYTILDWSALVGLVVMLVTFPIPGMIAKKIQGIKREEMKKVNHGTTDVVSTAMNVLRMIKLFGWEPQMEQRIHEKREEELGWIWKFKMMELVNTNLNFCLPLLTMLVTYATYVASTVFASISAFDVLRNQLRSIFFYLPKIVSARVSLDRINDFLTETEILDHFEVDAQFIDTSQESDLVGFRDATFAWSKEGAMHGTHTPSKRGFTLKVDGELYFKPGSINLIIGPTSSGKTSMLMALLGEMHWMPSSPRSWFNLPRKGGVAYAAQESWVQNETIKSNIIFGAPYDEVRYKKVLHQCALEKDLELFEAGDQTEVGEKGLTLRVTLARAIYSSAAILLLDDVLAALDVHTAKWIVNKCFAGDLVQGRTVIVVTHNIAIAHSITHFVVSLGLNGRVVSQGSISEAIEKDELLAAAVAKEQEILEPEVEVDNRQEVKKEDKASGKLVMAEEISVGHVSWAAFKLYLAALGGRHGLLFWIFFIGFFMISNLANTLQTWFLGYWATQYEDNPPSEVHVSFYLTGYASLLLFGTSMWSLAYYVYYLGTMRASRTVHNKLVVSILGTTFRWLDTTPTSRVIARCTQDIRAIDGPLSSGLAWITELSIRMLFNLGAVVILTPAFLVPGAIVGVVGVLVGRIYMKAQLSIKREMSNAKSPVLGHFGAVMAGLTSIRAYGAEGAVIQDSLTRIDKYSRSARMFYNLNRWMSVRVDILGAFFSAGLATYLVYVPAGHRAANVGFSLNMAVAFSSLILWWVRFLNEVEVSGALERVDSYIKIEQEPKPSELGIPPAYWPASGDLRVEKLSARYSPDGPKVLHDLSFHIKSGERVGIVGRTGSGKSSLTLSLLRCIFTEGDVYLDGLPTNKMNLDALRSNITVIPQVPELLSGTLRHNLDPFQQHGDAVLNDALRSAGLFAIQKESEEAPITLDSPISSGGGNLSVGQRQILALARAMVRGSKLLILDEDYKTDAAIQASLHNELNAATQLIVAHRLQTIMDAHKIMVLDAGKLSEFGTPWELLRNEKGMLRALVDESGDSEALYSMASSASSRS
ncbi:hypothetical protein BU15DRAFT_90237 [Melanogaster broomeanus]|nr:hypothetical protein BU15DRAFT_90237 [Melanogaster broomeanus]